MQEEERKMATQKMGSRSKCLFLKFIAHIIRSTTWQFGTNFNCFSVQRPIRSRSCWSWYIFFSFIVALLSTIFIASIRSGECTRSMHRIEWLASVHHHTQRANTQKTASFLWRKCCCNLFEFQPNRWQVAHTMCLLHHFKTSTDAQSWLNKSIAWPFRSRTMICGFFQWRRASSNNKISWNRITYVSNGRIRNE